jgi:hypothetical protein
MIPGFIQKVSLVRQCQVLDLSRTGVRLRVANAHNLPYTFNLLLSKNSTGRSARVKWRRDNELGAEFFKADPSSTSQSTDCAQRTNCSSALRSTADAPRTNSSSPSRSTVDASRANSSSASFVTAEAPRAVKQQSPENQKSETLMFAPSLHAEAQKPHISNLEANSEEVVGGVSNDETKSDCQMCDPSEQLDRAETKSDCQSCDPSEQLKWANEKKVKSGEWIFLGCKRSLARSILR